MGKSFTNLESSGYLGWPLHTKNHSHERICIVEYIKCHCAHVLYWQQAQASRTVRWCSSRTRYSLMLSMEFAACLCSPWNRKNRKSLQVHSICTRTGRWAWSIDRCYLFCFGFRPLSGDCLVAVAVVFLLSMFFFLNFCPFSTNNFFPAFDHSANTDVVQRARIAGHHIFYGAIDSCRFRHKYGTNSSANNDTNTSAIAAVPCTRPRLGRSIEWYSKPEPICVSLRQLNRHRRFFITRYRLVLRQHPSVWWLLTINDRY